MIDIARTRPKNKDMKKKIFIPTLLQHLSIPVIPTPGITLGDVSDIIVSGNPRRHLGLPAVGKFRYIYELGDKGFPCLLDELALQLLLPAALASEKKLLQGIIRWRTPVHVYK